MAHQHTQTITTLLIQTEISKHSTNVLKHKHIHQLSERKRKTNKQSLNNTKQQNNQINKTQTTTIKPNTT